MDYDVLQSVLNDLPHLLIPTSQINFDSKIRLGAGGYGVVFSAVLSRPLAALTKVAIKQLRIDQPEVEEDRLRVAKRLARELKVWAKAKHSNILELVGISFSDENDYPYFVSVHMAHGNVKDYIKAKEPTAAIRLKFVKGITLGIHYLHNCDPPICHGDLKPSNVLVNDDIDAVLCDFGLATFVTTAGLLSGLTTSKSVKGTTRYMSPELFEEGEVTHTFESDTWAWACTVFEVLTDCAPYPNAKTEYQVMMSLSKQRSPGLVDLLQNVVPDVKVTHPPCLNCLKSVIEDCWNFDPGRRPLSATVLLRLGYVHETVKARRFPEILYDALEDPNMEIYLQWSEQAEHGGIFIPSIELFVHIVMPRYFPEMKQWGSFQKQLSNYGFRKTVRSTTSATYSHWTGNFRQGRRDLLAQMLRGPNVLPLRMTFPVNLDNGIM